MLAILYAGPLHAASTVLGAGDSLALYTAGVTEARHDGKFFGEERLRAILRATAGREAQHVADGVVAAAVDFQGGDARDDIAVVAVAVLPDAVR